MLKSDLQTGMRVTFKNDRDGIVLLQTKFGDVILSGDGLYIDLDDYNDDFSTKYSGWEITEVESAKLARAIMGEYVKNQWTTVYTTKTEAQKLADVVYNMPPFYTREELEEKFEKFLKEAK